MRAPQGTSMPSSIDSVHQPYSTICPLATQHCCSVAELDAKTAEEISFLKAYKLGKRRWSYNQCQLIIQQEAGGKQLFVTEIVSCRQPALDLQYQESGVVYLARLSNQQRVRVHIYIVLEVPEVIQHEDQPNQETYQWTLLSRNACEKGCHGPILRPIQRYGRLGRRSGAPAEVLEVENSGSHTSASSGSQLSSTAKVAAAASSVGQLRKVTAIKDARYMYLSIDEASTHVNQRFFRLLTGVYSHDGASLLGTSVSLPIRVLANNDVPTGAAFIPLIVPIAQVWEGWSIAAKHLGESSWQAVERHGMNDTQKPKLALSPGPNVSSKEDNVKSCSSTDTSEIILEKQFRIYKESRRKSTGDQLLTPGLKHVAIGEVEPLPENAFQEPSRFSDHSGQTPDDTEPTEVAVLHTAQSLPVLQSLESDNGHAIRQDHEVDPWNSDHQLPQPRPNEDCGRLSGLPISEQPTPSCRWMVSPDIYSTIARGTATAPPLPAAAIAIGSPNKSKRCRDSAVKHSQATARAIDNPFGRFRDSLAVDQPLTCCPKSAFDCEPAWQWQDGLLHSDSAKQQLRPTEWLFTRPEANTCGDVDNLHSEEALRKDVSPDTISPSITNYSDLASSGAGSHRNADPASFLEENLGTDDSRHFQSPRAAIEVESHSSIRSQQAFHELQNEALFGSTEAEMPISYGVCGISCTLLDELDNGFCADPHEAQLPAIDAGTVDDHADMSPCKSFLSTGSRVISSQLHQQVDGSPSAPHEAISMARHSWRSTTCEAESALQPCDGLGLHQSELRALDDHFVDLCDGSDMLMDFNKPFAMPMTTAEPGFAVNEDLKDAAQIVGQGPSLQDLAEWLSSS